MRERWKPSRCPSYTTPGSQASFVTLVASTGLRSRDILQRSRVECPDGINIIDDPHRNRGLRSKPFDAEGLPNAKKYLAEDGVLKTWVMDLASSRQLGLSSTGNAARGTASPPSPGVTNLYMEAGDKSPAELMSDISSGFYVTELIGMGINMVTGDYSAARRASGLKWRDSLPGD